MLRVLHTSDWHIGRTLYSKKRYEEYEKFLDWLVGVIVDEAVDVLLISGDIFDTATPSNKAFKLYYSFLSATARTSCRSIIIIGGNHDSATSLDAPKQLLNALNITVVGAAREDPAEEVVCIYGEDGEAELMVCAVPFLRERDIRMVGAGDILEDRAEQLAEGVYEHYKRVVAEARSKVGTEVPVLVMGHLFACGADGSGDDSERELYVGTLGQVDITRFPPASYFALGHLHRRQRVGGAECMRYSGSPLAMSFGESTQEKSVVLLEFTTGKEEPEVMEIEVPVFQRLERVSGDLMEILADIARIKGEQEEVWLEIEYTGREVCTDLKERVEEAVVGSKVEICRVRNRIGLELSLQQMSESSDIELTDLDSMTVFRMCLQEHDISGEQGGNLRRFIKRSC